MNSSVPLPVASENIHLLTGDDWAPWFVKAVDQAVSSVHLSIYLLSDHWRSPVVGNLDLVNTLAQASVRGLNCRCIIDQPHVVNRQLKYNIKAAAKLQASGWKIRVMPDKKPCMKKSCCWINKLPSLVPIISPKPVPSVILIPVWRWSQRCWQSVFIVSFGSVGA